MPEYVTREDAGRYFDDIKALFRETDRKFQKTDRKISSLGDRLGEFAQEMVRPAVVRLF
jgi:hypothetical protein